tara:strand:- start:8658 stop:8912 length:255 start_codon:yes stop_codon:yes gene_type:complete
MKKIKIKKPMLLGIIGLLLLSGIIHYFIYNSNLQKATKLEIKAIEIEEHVLDISKKINALDLEKECPEQIECPSCICPKCPPSP